MALTPLAGRIISTENGFNNASLGIKRHSAFMLGSKLVEAIANDPGPLEPLFERKEVGVVYTLPEEPLLPRIFNPNQDFEMPIHTDYGRGTLSIERPNPIVKKLRSFLRREVWHKAEVLVPGPYTDK